jgi:DNA-binding winged helix-turn-helix (wHTH) protein
MRITFNGYMFDSHRRSLTRGASPVALTPKAFALLDALIGAAPNPLSKDDIYALLWPGVFVETGNLHNLISELRGALGDEQHEVIRTVHRIGYAFAAPFEREESTAPRLLIGDDVIELGEGETVVGRERLGTPDSSRRHARLIVSGQDISIEDLGSKNGTFVNGARIEGRASLRDGDEIVFGRTRAILRVVDTSASTVTA